MICILLRRNDPTKDVSAYQYSRHMFEAQESPTCANFALHRTARNDRETYPAAANAVLVNFYMDDLKSRLLGLVTDSKDAIQLCSDLVKLLTLGGFKLTKFVSNAPGLAAKTNSDVGKVGPTKDIAATLENMTHVLSLNRTMRLMIWWLVAELIKNSITHLAAPCFIFLFSTP